MHALLRWLAPSHSLARAHPGACARRSLDEVRRQIAHVGDLRVNLLAPHAPQHRDTHPQRAQCALPAARLLGALDERVAVLALQAYGELGESKHIAEAEEHPDVLQAAARLLHGRAEREGEAEGVADVRDGEEFDRAMQLFVDVDDEQLQLLRRRMGFVDQAQVSFREFEAALRLLVPENGARPDLRRLQARVRLTDLLGGPAAVARLQAFQRQRAQRLAQRMFTFGYDTETIRLVVKTLFVSRIAGAQ